MTQTEFLTRQLRRTVFSTAATNGQPVNTEGDQPAQGQNAGAGVDGNPDANAQGENTQPQNTAFTPEQQAVFDAAVAERLARAKTQWAKEEADKRKREGMAESERIAAEKADAERERDEAREDAKRARWEAQLAPHVVNPEDAIRLIDPEKHIDAAGKVKVDQFLKDKPYLKREQPKQTGPGTGGSMGSGGDPKKDLGAAIAADRAAGRRK